MVIALVFLTDAPLLGLEMAKTTMDSAGLSQVHQWGVLLPRYVELVRWVQNLQAYQIGSKAIGGLEHLPHGFMACLWDRAQGDDGDTFNTAKLQTEAVATALLHYKLAKCMSENPMIMFNNGDDLEVFDKALYRQNFQHLQTGTTASEAGGICGIAIIIQRQGNFLSGEYTRFSAKSVS